MTRPLRSMLFTPGSDQRKIEKALTLEADSLILDLEDAVPIAEKDSARGLVLDILGRPEARTKQVFVRVNAICTPFIIRDLTAVVIGRPSGLMIPKSESGEEIRRIDWFISQMERDQGMPLGEISLIPLVETAKGVVNALEIGLSCPRVRCIAFGALDYTLDIGTNFSKEGLEVAYARTHLVVVSRAAAIEPPIDTVFPDFKDAEGFERDCRLARQLGFQGKLAIHPGQIGTCHSIFSPTAKEIEYAVRVRAAYDEAARQGIGAIQLQGKMIDRPVVEWARRLLGAAEQLGIQPEAKG